MDGLRPRGAVIELSGCRDWARLVLVEAIANQSRRSVEKALVTSPAVCTRVYAARTAYMAKVCETILPLSTTNVSVPRGTSLPMDQVI